MDKTLKQPLISVIIRTIGRKEFLLRSISSIIHQTYQSIELVIVNDSSNNLHWIQEHFQGLSFLLKIIDNPSHHGRSIAANIGLNHVTGNFIIFLDDDDYFHSEHIEKLCNTLMKNPQCIASYTGTLLVTEDGIVINKMNQCVDPTRMMIGNCFPIHSILFKKNIVETYSIRFDTALTHGIVTGKQIGRAHV